MSSNYSARLQPKPYKIHEKVCSHLNEFKLEHGTAGRLGEQFNDSVDVWLLFDPSLTELGFAWWVPAKDNPAARVITIGVYKDHQCQGVGRFALRFLIDQAKRLDGVVKLKAQVNTNREDSGLRARFLLYSNNFRIDRTGQFIRYEKLSDEDYLKHNPSPVFFELNV
jgi:GNAT superfamily N-acetyltransferase